MASMFGRAKQRQPALQPGGGSLAGEDAAARVSRLRASFALPFVSAPQATAAPEMPAGGAVAAAGGAASSGAKRAVEAAVGDGSEAPEEAEEGGREEADEAATTREGAQPCRVVHCSAAAEPLGMSIIFVMAKRIT